MKTRVYGISKRSISFLIGVMILFTSVFLASVFSVKAASNWTLYLAIDDPTNVYSGDTIKCNRNYKGDGDDWHQDNMTDTGKYWAGKKLYSITFTDSYSGLGALYFQVYNGNTYKEQWKLWGDKDWHAYSTNYSGHVFVYETKEYTDTYSTSSTKYGWSEGGDYYLYNNITDSWYGGNNAPKMTHSTSDTSQYYYDLYLKQNEKTSSDCLLFRFWDANDSKEIGPSWVSGHRSTISDNSNATNLNDITNWDDKETAWKYSTTAFTSGYYYRVRVTLDVDDNGKGKVYVSHTQLANMNPTFSKTSYEKGETWDLTSYVGVTSSSNVGTVSYSTYQYYDTSWHTISTPSAWVPSSTAITKLRVTATDTGVVSTGDNDTRNAYSARTQTKETTITVTDTLPRIDTFTVGGAASTTLNIGETATLASTTSNAGGNSVTYSSSDNTIVSITGTTVKALKPGTVTITASLTGAASKTVTVIVNTPTVATYSYSTSDILIGKTSPAPSKSLTSGKYNSNSTITWSYSLADSTYATINSTTGVITAKNTKSALTPAAKNAKVTATITYNGVSYTTAVKTTTYSVYAYYLLGFADWNQTDAKLFKYDSTRNVWTVNQSLSNQTYTYNTTNGFKIVKSLNGTDTYYGKNNTMARSTADNNSTDWTFSTGENNAGITADIAGTYVFDLNVSNMRVTAHYPHTVTLNKNGKTTTSWPQNPTATYNGYATRPSSDPTAAGYTFVNWYKEAACTNVFNFSTEKITVNTTVYAKWQVNSYTITYPSSTPHYTLGGTQPAGANYNEVVSFTVTPDNAYVVDSVTYTVGNGTPQNATAGSNNEYHFNMPAGNVTIAVTLAAKTPVISDFKINEETGDQTFQYNSKDLSDSSSYASIFYKQPLKIKMTTQIGSETASFSLAKNPTTYCNVTNKEYSTFNPGPITINYTTVPPGNEDDLNSYTEYTLTVKVKNAPVDVSAVETEKTLTIRIYYNSSQKAYYKIKNLYENTVESESAVYYNDGANTAAFTDKRTEAGSIYTTSGTWNKCPDYNAASTHGEVSYYDEFETAFRTLQQKAKTTTIYVLSKYNDTSNYVSIHNASNGTTADYKHFKQYHYYLEDVYSNNTTYSKGQKVFDDHCMKYEGMIRDKTTTSKYYYLYSFTYAGKTNATIYTDTSKNSAYAGSKRLTGEYTSAVNLTEFKKYYINIYNTSASASSTSKPISAYTELQTTKNVARPKAEIDSQYTKTDIKNTYMQLGTNGSLYTTSNPATEIEEVKFKIQTTPGSDSDLIDWITNSSKKWQPKKQGRYAVYYQTKIKNSTPSANSTARFTTLRSTYFIYVSFEEIKVYFDMNDNIGNPSLCFKYKTDSNGNVIEQSETGTSNDLVVDMGLVNGSESIYSATINLKKLNNDYKIRYKNTGTGAFQTINIDEIRVDDQRIGTASYVIPIDSYFSGSVWFKANSTSMSAINRISSSEVTTSFRAVDENGNHLDDAFVSVSGTGITTDVVEQDTNRVYGIHQVTYAAQEANTSKIHYSVCAKAKPSFSVKTGENTSDIYYFDRWLKIVPSPEYIPFTNGVMDSLDISGLQEVSTKSDYNINSAPLADDEDPSTTDDGNITYVAVFQKHSESTTKLRVKITYNFYDFDTSDGNYAFDSSYNDSEGHYNKVTKASYTKYVKIDTTSSNLSTTYNDLIASQTSGGETTYPALDTLAINNMPIIKSNYFNYSYKADSAQFDNQNSSVDNKLISVNVALTEDARQYSIKVTNAGGTEISSLNKTGYYQQPVEIDASGQNIANPAWKDTNNKILATGNVFKYRFVGGGETGGTRQVIKLDNVLGASVTNKSVIANGYSEVYVDGGSEKVKHNFYIVDYCGQGKLVGGGVIYATTDNNGSFRQGDTVATTFNNPQLFIEGIISAPYSTEYPAQTIDNIGFRYLPYDGAKDIYRFSSVLNAYHYVFTAKNTNSESYANQKLRVKSFMVYDNGTANSHDYHVVVSDGYGEVSRYITQS